MQISFLRGAASWLLAVIYIADFAVLIAALWAIGFGLALTIVTLAPEAMLLVVAGLAGLIVFYAIMRLCDWSADRLYP